MLSYRDLFLRHVAQTSDKPLAVEIQKAKGVYLYGKNDEKYLDLISGISVSNLGHNHPKVIKAIKKQLKRYLHLMVYGELIQSPQVKLAKAISATLPEKLNQTFFVNSGSEAVEGALKLAKRYTGKTEIISAKNAYHGSTHGALSIGGGEYFKNTYRPLLPDIRQINYNCFEDLDKITTKTACVIVETVQGEAGIVVPKKNYLKELKQRCVEQGVLLILDEIQTGFGRTGTFWGFENFEVEPDILVAAKGMGGGLPLGAFISSAEIMEVLKNNPFLGHITTFGGHPLSCAASLATLKVIQKNNLAVNALKLETIFKENIKHGLVREVRSKGLMIAVELGDAEKVQNAIKIALDKGIMTDWFLYCDTAIRIAPPLIMEEKTAFKVCHTLCDIFDEIS